MKKMFVTGALFAATFAQNARADISAEILSTLIQAAPTARLVDQAGKPMEKRLTTLLADALASKTLVKVGENARIVNVEGQCDLSGTSQGQENFDCSLAVGDGDYDRTANGYVGPRLESGFTLKFKAARRVPNGPNNKTPLHLQGPVTATFAG